jgi:glucokinase
MSHSTDGSLRGAALPDLATGWPPGRRSYPAPVDRTAVGVDLGGTKILGVVVDPADPGVIVRERRIGTPAGGRAVLAAIEELVISLCARPVALGIGAAGLVDRDGMLRYGPNLPGATDVDFGRGLAHVSATVVVDNDNTCATWAEFRLGAARGTTDCVFVGLGTGLGAGLIVDGSILHGAHGFAGEAGHMVVEPDGIECVCGRFGCWERYASGAALARMARESVAAGRGRSFLTTVASPDAITGEDVARAFRAGDSDAIEIVDTMARWLARGLAGIIGLVDPEVIVLGGGVTEELGDDLCSRVDARIPDFLMGAAFRPHVPVRPALLGNRAAALGAALLALDRL